jgi:hypothetical protein
MLPEQPRFFQLIVAPYAGLRPAARRGNGFVKRREDPTFAVPIHVGPQVWIDTRKDHPDLLACRLVD